MKRSDGAKAWSTVLSELAQVRVSVEWERPTWRVSWQDGPTREALMSRAAALGEYRVGAPLPFEDLRFRPQQFRDGSRGGVVGAGEPGVWNVGVTSTPNPPRPPAALHIRAERLPGTATAPLRAHTRPGSHPGSVGTNHAKAPLIAGNSVCEPCRRPDH